MASKITNLVETKISPIIEKMGYEVVEIEYAKKIDGMNLTFYINKVGGINIDDCEKVHKAIDKPLDDLNPTNEEKYILSVSSVGLDSPLKTDKDLKRNIGKEIDIKLYKPINKYNDFNGIIVELDNKKVIIKANEKEIKLPRNLIGNIVLHLEF